MAIPKNTRKPRIAIKPRSAPATVPKPVKEPVKVIKDFDLILSRLREMTAKYEGRYDCVTDPDELYRRLRKAEENGRLSLDTETTGLDVFRDQVVGFSIYTEGINGTYVPLRHLSRFTGKIDASQPQIMEISQVLRELGKKTAIDMANAQFDLLMLTNSLGVNYIDYEIDDALIAARLLDTERKAGKRSLKDLHADYCEATTRGPKFAELFPAGSFNLCPYKLGYTYAARDAEMTWELMRYLEEWLKREKPLQGVYQNIEKPLIPVLARMRLRGVLIDQEKRSELTIKYKEMMESAERRFHELYAPYIPRIRQYQASAAYAKKGGKIDLPVKIGSDDQIKILLWTIMGLPHDPANTSVDKNVLAGVDHEIAKTLLDYRMCKKLLSTYLEGLEKFIQKDGCVHGNIRQIGADTGRTSACIAAGTLIECPGVSKPIEEMEVGDDVYTYDDDGKLCIRKVTRVIDNGFRPCVSLKWQSTGTNETGFLVCTPDHMIKTKHDGWVMADHLKPRQKLFHLRVRENNYQRVLSGTNDLYESEDVWLKYNYLGCQDSKIEVHHIDGNHKNNRLSNLVLLDSHTHKRLHGLKNKEANCQLGRYMGKMTPEQHAKYLETRRSTLQRYFEEHGRLYQGLPYTRDEWIALMDSLDWRLTGTKHDYGSVVNNLQVHNINYIDEYRKRAEEKQLKPKTVYLRPKHLIYALKLADGNVEVAASYFGVSVDKFIEACQKHSVAYNHMTLSLTDAGIQHVFDLEVEETHCYIAGEICVHNCDPNLQNIPSRNREIRLIYRARPGCALISCDYSAQEPRLMAVVSKDPAMIKAYQEGKDLYSVIAAAAYNTTYEECLEHRPDGSLYLDGKKRRTEAKSIVLGIGYGRSIPSIAEQLKCTPEEAQVIYDKVTKSFPGLVRAQEAAAEMAHKYGYVSDLWGRRRHLSVMKHDDYEFEYLDGCNPNFDPLDPLSALDIQDNQLSPEEAKIHLKKLQEMKWWKDKQAYIDYIRSEFGIITHDYSRQRKDTKRQCLNAIIQGSAASLSKMAMVAIDTDPLLLKCDCQLLLMVHDEVICEAPKKNLDIVVPRIQHLMEHAADELPVPFKSDVEVSEHWYGAEIEYHNQEIDED